MSACPRCSESRAELIDTTEDGRYWCSRCNTAWKPEPEPRLLEPVVRERRDLA